MDFSYNVLVNEKIKETLKYAGIDTNQKIVPIEIVEKACSKNLKQHMVPVQYQYLWYCLDGTRLFREEKSGKKLKPKVLFHPVYVAATDEILSVINKAIESVGTKKRFGMLCGRAPSGVVGWIKKEFKIPLTAVLKASQLCDLNPWELLKGCKLYGQCMSKDYVLYNDTINPEKLEVLVSIKAEGTISLSSARVEIEQIEDGIDLLKDLQTKVINSFNVPRKVVKFRVRTRTDGRRMGVLRINSAAFRQILCLRYGIPLGYKSYNIDIKTELEHCLNRETMLKILTKLLETEGTFGIERDRKFLRPTVSFTSGSKAFVNDVYTLMKKLGYAPRMPYQKDPAVYRVTLGRAESLKRMLEEILPYMKHGKKKKKAIEMLNIVGEILDRN